MVSACAGIVLHRQSALGNAVPLDGRSSLRADTTGGFICDCVGGWADYGSGFSWMQSLSIAEPALVLFVIKFFVVILYAQASPRGERGAH